MKKILSFLMFAILLPFGLLAQSVTLTFTGKDANNRYVRLNRVVIINQTKNWTETIYWPDTTLIIQNGTGINDVEAFNETSLRLSQNNPNPFNGTTDVLLTVADAGAVTLDIMDVNGRSVVETFHETSLPTGIHQFHVTLSSAGIYVMTARQNGKISSTKMVNNGGGNADMMEYTGYVVETFHETSLPSQYKSGNRGNVTRPFNFGDQMEYVGYAIINGIEDSVTISQQQSDSQEFIMMFEAEQIDGLPCQDAPTLTDVDGNVYNTVQIGRQCWMKENLRTTRYADNTAVPAGRVTSATDPYRYVPNNDESNVSTYGYLYNWPAVMHGAASSSTSQSGVQGICPDGWHVPSEAEWTQLTDYVSGLSGCWCSNDNPYIAKALSSITGWYNYEDVCTVGNELSANNATGFSALPAGNYYGGHYNFGLEASFWSTTESEYDATYARHCYLYYGNANVGTNYVDMKAIGYSVRCLHNYIQEPFVITSDVENITTSSATCGGEVTFDGGAAVTERGVCWSTTTDPTVEDSHTSDGIGTGSFTSTITGLTAGTRYYLRAYATNSEGTGYGEQKIFTTPGENDGQPCPGTPTLTDVDGNIYNTVMIGSQCWMKENLRTTCYADNQPIPMGSTFSTTDPYRCAPNNDESNVPLYGYLYNWPAVMYGASPSSANPSDVQGLCPDGWHVPSDAEWVQLTDYVNSQSQYVCSNYNTYIAKALAANIAWSSSSVMCAVGNDLTANNTIGFSALPAGESYNLFGRYTCFWSATEYSESHAYKLSISCDNARVGRYDESMGYKYSVRCLRDGENSSIIHKPAVTTSALDNITATSATCGGDITSDGGATVIVRGVCWSTSSYPTEEDNYTIDGSGTGLFSSNITGLVPATTYYVRAYATNSAGTGYGRQVIFTTPGENDGQPCVNAPTLTDIDGNTYNTVMIGRQCWMKENLRTTRYADNTVISEGSGNSNTDPYRYAPRNDENNVPTYGYLYNWIAVMHGESSSSANPSGVQGICPNGWHVPSNAEWTELVDYVSTQSQYVCGSDNTYIAKALASTTGWNSSSEECAVGSDAISNNLTNFSALPTGYNGGYYYYNFGYEATFWSATEYGGLGYCYYIDYDSALVRERNYWGQNYSVRCLKD